MERVLGKNWVSAVVTATDTCYDIPLKLALEKLLNNSSVLEQVR